MKMRSQTTLKVPVLLSGVGVHCGLQTYITIKPSVANTGVVFVRRDLVEAGFSEDAAEILAKPESVSSTQLGTTIQNSDGVSVSTIEHFMAALAICEIDNVTVEVTGPELPILDGSAQPFVEALLAAGTVSLQAPCPMLFPSESIEERLGDRFISFEPAAERRLEVTIAFEDEAIGVQSIALDLDNLALLQERMAPARTFCLLKQVEAMKAAGLGLGGSLENAVVVDDGRVLNRGNLRDPQEFVLHKALDLVGDLQLLGGPLAGQIKAYKPGHDLNTRFAHRITHALTQSMSDYRPEFAETRLSA